MVPNTPVTAANKHHNKHHKYKNRDVKLTLESGIQATKSHSRYHNHHYQKADTEPIAAPQNKSEMVPNAPAGMNVDENGNMTGSVVNEPANVVKNADGSESWTGSVENDPAGTVTNADGSKTVTAVVSNDPMQYQTADTEPIAAPQYKTEVAGYFS